MTTHVTSHDIADALLDALLESQDISRLKYTIGVFRKQFDGRTWRTVRKQPFTANLLDAIDAAIEQVDMELEDEERAKAFIELVHNSVDEHCK